MLGNRICAWSGHDRQVSVCDVLWHGATAGVAMSDFSDEAVLAAVKAWQDNAGSIYHRDRMRAALEAAERQRAIERRANCKHPRSQGAGWISSTGGGHSKWWCPDCLAHGETRMEPQTRDSTAPWCYS
jgi:hypothetical protein